MKDWKGTNKTERACGPCSRCLDRLNPPLVILYFPTALHMLPYPDPVQAQTSHLHPRQRLCGRPSSRSGATLVETSSPRHQAGGTSFQTLESLVTILDHLHVTAQT